MEAAPTNEMALADTPREKMRALNKVISSMGVAVFISQSTKTTSRPAHIVRIAMVNASAQSNGLVKPITNITRAVEERKAPIQSNPPRLALGTACIILSSSRTTKGIRAHNTPKGTFM